MVSLFVLAPLRPSFVLVSLQSHVVRCVPTLAQHAPSMHSTLVTIVPVVRVHVVVVSFVVTVVVLVAVLVAVPVLSYTVWFSPPVSYVSYTISVS